MAPIVPLLSLSFTRRMRKYHLRTKHYGDFMKSQFPSNSIAYFNQSLNRNGINGDSWSLEAVTNQRLSSKRNSLPAWLHTKWNPEELATRLNYRIVSLFSSSSRVPVAWLGKVLADFYRIEQRSLLSSL